MPPLRLDLRIQLSRTRNPFFQHAEAEYILAERDGRVIGRVAAIDNRLHYETHPDDRVGFFGFFEAEDDQAVADALLRAAGDWVRARGLPVLRGPASFSVNDDCGLLVDGFDTPNVLLTPWHPPYYGRLIERAGFAKVKDLILYEAGSLEHYVTPAPRMLRAEEILKKRYGIRIRLLDLRNFKAEVDLIKRLYNACWESNWGFIPMTDAEIDHLAKQFRPVVIREMVSIAETADGTPVGFVLGLPDLNQVLRGNRNGRLLPGALRILWGLKRRTFRRARVALLGVIPQYRGTGLDAVLYHRIWSGAGSVGIYWGEGGWTLEDNVGIRHGLEKIGFVAYKTLRLYDKPL
ncbi:MAG TPA: hypothetical protein VJ773_05695 [Gemmatimonadales bacterium]|nr:hypothetical protein [Gemmatimonadales bacterium]